MSAFSLLLRRLQTKTKLKNYFLNAPTRSEVLQKSSLD